MKSRMLDGDSRLNEPGLRGRVIVMTGASAGVGRATARLAARSGAAVGLIGRDEEALRALHGALERDGARAAWACADVADAQAIADAAARFEQTLGPIDIWINNAMATVFSLVDALDSAEVRRVTEVTYLGSVHGTLAALSAMKRRNQGVIVQVGSALAYRGIPLQAAYCGAKHALQGFLESLRTELLSQGSNVALTTVHLPAIDTPQFEWARTHQSFSPRPVAPVYAPELAARAILTAAMAPRREYWLGGRTALTILGNAVAPGLLDRYLARNAIAGQQTDQRVSPQRADNLQHPVAGLHRTRGRFTAESRSRAWLLTDTMCRGAAVLGAGAIGALAMACWRRHAAHRLLRR